MRVGDIDTTRGNGLWYYVPGSYKTSHYVGKIKFPLGLPEQKLIAPYLEGKSVESAVFSPRTAVQERNAERRVNRTTNFWQYAIITENYNTFFRQPMQFSMHTAKSP